MVYAWNSLVSTATPNRVSTNFAQVSHRSAANSNFEPPRSRQNEEIPNPKIEKPKAPSQIPRFLMKITSTLFKKATA